MTHFSPICLSLPIVGLLAGCDLSGADAGDAPPLEATTLEPPPLAPPAEFDLQIDNYIATWGQNWPTFRFHGVVAVGVGHEVVSRRAYGFSNLESQTPNEISTPVRIGTLSVHLAVATTLTLVRDGLIGIDDPAAKWVPGMKLPRSVTVEHLLTHTSGIPSFTQTFAFEMGKSRPATHRAIVEGIATEPLEFEPGTEFAPSNSNSAVLALIAERVLEQDFQQIARVRVLEPVGMNHTVWGAHDSASPAGLEFDEAEHLVPVERVDPRAFGAAGAWTSTVDDMLRFYAALGDGQFGGGAELERVLGANPFEQPYALVEGITGEHRSFLWLGLIDGHNSAVLLVPEDDLRIVVLGNAEVAPAAEIATDLAGIFYGFRPSPRIEAREIPVAFAELLPLTGRWRMTARSRDQVVDAVDPETFDAITEVRLEWLRGDDGEGALVLARGGVPSKQLHPRGPGRFFFKDLPQSTAKTSKTATGVRTLTLEREGFEIHYRQLAGTSPLMADDGAVARR